MKLDSDLTDALRAYRYAWPTQDLSTSPAWRSLDGAHHARRMPESDAELAEDSRWPAFFPSPICLVTATDGHRIVLEKVVGPSIVNRWPYIAALSFCVRPLSARHHPRNAFIDVLEAGGTASIQFLAPGAALERAMRAIAEIPEGQSAHRVVAAGLTTRPGVTHSAPVFDDAYLVYEGRLAAASSDVEGKPVLQRPSLDVGSHRVYFLEIEALQLRADIAQGRSQIFWRSLPAWRATGGGGFRQATKPGEYQAIKSYTPHYFFPSAGTAAYTADYERNGMAVKLLKRETKDTLRGLSDDEARWPCYFPSSVGMIAAWGDDGIPTLLPCGSTTVLSRQPMVIAPAISYASINQRYAPRASLELIRRAGAFTCGVPYIDEGVRQAISYAGNVSIAQDPDKVMHAGLEVQPGIASPLMPALPVQFECRIVGEERLGTHALLLGEVQRIVVRDDVTSHNPLEWFPWADVVAAHDR